MLQKQISGCSNLFDVMELKLKLDTAETSIGNLGRSLGIFPFFNFFYNCSFFNYKLCSLQMTQIYQKILMTWGLQLNLDLKIYLVLDVLFCTI